jgi:ribonuclease HI
VLNQIAFGIEKEMVTKPHYLLFCDGHSPKTVIDSGRGATGSNRGHWRFILEEIESGTRMEVSDAELMQAPERAALLAVVRGLEALEQPSRVTLVTTSRYVARGLQFGLSEWRESNYCWEHFGSVQPIRNADLWQRVDHALQFHQITCRWISGDVSEEGESASTITVEPLAKESSQPVAHEPAPNRRRRLKRSSRSEQMVDEEQVRTSEKAHFGLRDSARKIGETLRGVCRVGLENLENLGLGRTERIGAGA